MTFIVDVTEIATAYGWMIGNRKEKNENENKRLTFCYL